MLNYVIFIIRISLKKFNYFSLSAEKKAIILEHNKLFFRAGLMYKRLENYEDALYCFKKVQAYPHIIDCCEHLGDLSSILLICKKQRLYKLGAQICIKYQLDQDAAYFYSFFNLPLAIKYYKKHQSWYKLGTCYLKQYRFALAHDTFSKCINPLEQISGIQLVEEAAITLYLTHQYQAALQLFIHLGDYLSALECAKKLHNPSLICDIYKLLASYFAKEEHFEAALYYKTLIHQMH